MNRRLKSMTLLCLSGLISFTQIVLAQTDAAKCGGIGQSACAKCTQEQCVYFPLGFCCFKEACECIASSEVCNGDLKPNRGTCDVNRSGWAETPIDNSRNAAGCNNMNCWQYDDTVRDNLEMNPDKLNFITRLNSSHRSLPVDGRYIYVYRKSDNSILIRNFDRDESDKQWMYPGNCRERTSFGQYACATAVNRSGQYLHVRHSQLNGGWSPVWCAGELRIENRRICMANNESGHFKPKKSCLAYLRQTLKDFGVPVDANAVFDDFSKASASETCKQIHDEL